MDKLPSQSLSKTLLIATPLFLLVLAILNSSEQLSYLFILKFVNNMASQADLTFIPTSQPVTRNTQFLDDFLLNKFNITQKSTIENQIRVPPLVNISIVNDWASKQNLVKGTSPRWMIPAQSGNLDILLLFINITKQQQIGIGASAELKQLNSLQIAISQQLANSKGLKVGDKLQIDFQLENIMKGSKLLQKFQDQQSDEEYKPQYQKQFNLSDWVHTLYQSLNLINTQIRQKDISNALKLIINQTFTFEYTITQTFYPQGIYPSALHNVALFEYNQLAQIFGKILIQVVNNDTFTHLVPSEYQKYLNMYKNNKIIQKQSILIIQKAMQEVCLTQVVSFNKRTQIYHPSAPIKSQFSKMLESIPGQVEVIALYPLYVQTLALKYFFQSVLQIFTFVSCLLYFYTMSLVLKQLYEQKQIQVGLWRTLGAGGIRNMQLAIEVESNKLTRSRNTAKQASMNFKEKLFYFWQILNKVGYIYYWFASCVVSIVLYLLLKWFIFARVCQKLRFQTINQSWLSPVLIFFGVFGFLQWLILGHINRIYNNPLVQTIKPTKRTYDLVKIRIIDFSTFGISSDTLLVAIMLVYYGVSAYYFIPYAILDNNENLQIWLFNSIFIFMILGSVLLITVLQSRFEVGIISLIAMISTKFRKLKKIMMKNIQAKQYKNIKVSLVTALIFAFLLFFSAGIKIEIRIIESFIQRALGSDIVLENYQPKKFNMTLINNYLDSKNLQYSWLSSILNSNQIKFSFISHVNRLQINKPIKVLTNKYLQSAYSKYYVPTSYMESDGYYSQLPQGFRNGFDMIYCQNGSSAGKFDPKDTLKRVDPLHVNTHTQFGYQSMLIAPNEQIINIVVSKNFLKTLGVKVGSLYKLKVSNQHTGLSYFVRSRIVHSFQAGPGFDILWSIGFISEQQAKYLYQIIGKPPNDANKNEKLFIKSPKEGSLDGVGQAILSMSPQHTQLFEMKLVTQSFSLLTDYLDYFVFMITVIMAILSVVFLSVYTISKCRQEAEMFKMLRAIGVTVSQIRRMVFLEILIRIVVSVFSGIALGLVFSLGFSKQIQQFLMINTPAIDLRNIIIIAILLITVFGVSVSMSTQYLKKRTVLNTTKV